MVEEETETRDGDGCDQRILLGLAAARGAKDALERWVLISRQAVRALQLAERAITAETHALTWSAAAATEQLAGRSAGGDDDDESAHHDIVAVSARRYEELLPRVEDEERKADTRVEEAEAQRRAGEGATCCGRGEAGGGKKREAAQDGRRRDELRGKTVTGKGREMRSQSWRVCLIMKKKLGGFFCNVA